MTSPQSHARGHTVRTKQQLRNIIFQSHRGMLGSPLKTVVQQRGRRPAKYSRRSNAPCKQPLPPVVAAVPGSHCPEWLWRVVAYTRKCVRGCLHGTHCCTCSTYCAAPVAMPLPQANVDHRRCSARGPSLYLDLAWWGGKVQSAWISHLCHWNSTLQVSYLTVWELLL